MQRLHAGRCSSHFSQTVSDDNKKIGQRKDPPRAAVYTLNNQYDSWDPRI